jgi:hypothetical protein
MNTELTKIVQDKRNFGNVRERAKNIEGNQKRNFGSHFCRSIYANIAWDKFGSDPKAGSQNYFLSNILGHTEGSLMTSTSYMNIRISRRPLPIGLNADIGAELMTKFETQFEELRDQITSSDKRLQHDKPDRDYDLRESMKRKWETTSVDGIDYIVTNDGDIIHINTRKRIPEEDRVSRAECTLYEIRKADPFIDLSQQVLRDAGYSSRFSKLAVSRYLSGEGTSNCKI